MPKFKRDEMLRDNEGHLWRYAGRDGSKYTMQRYQPSYIQWPMSEADIIQKGLVPTGEFFSIAKHCPPEPLPEPVCEADELKGVRNGWLSPDGKIYTCNNGGHRGLAWRLHYFGVMRFDGDHAYNVEHGDYHRGEVNLLNRGWVKIYTLDPWNVSRSTTTYFTDKNFDFRFTKAQRDTIAMWGVANNQDVSSYLKEG